MDIEEIKKLMKAMGEHQIHKLSLKNKSGEEISLEKGGVAPLPPQEIPPSTPHPHPHKKSEPLHKEKFHEEEPPGEYITSPMVGTFYSSPSPDDPPFVKVGDKVDTETVVCIVEAMKVMNEVKAEKSGIIQEVYIENMQPVEYGTKLFRIVSQ